MGCVVYALWEDVLMPFTPTVHADKSELTEIGYKGFGSHVLFLAFFFFLSAHILA